MMDIAKANDNKITDFKSNIVFEFTQYFHDEFHTDRVARPHVSWLLTSAKLVENPENAKEKHIVFTKKMFTSEEYFFHYGLNGAYHTHLVVAPCMNPLIAYPGIKLATSITLTKEKINSMLEKTKNGETIMQSLDGYTLEGYTDVKFEGSFLKKQNILYLTAVNLIIPIKTWNNWLTVYINYLQQMALPKSTSNHYDLLSNSIIHE